MSNKKQNNHTVVVVPTCLLAAVAKWAHGDPGRTIGCVAFQPGRMVATDGHRLVIVPHETHGQSFGVQRAHLLAAVAAQNSLARDGIDPQVGHDLVDDDGDITLADGPHGDRTIDLMPVASGPIAIGIGDVTMHVPRGDISMYPTVDAVVVAEADCNGPPDYMLDARFLAAVEEVNTAHANYRSGVRFTKWGSLGADGIRGPLTLTSATGVTFVIMPQRETPA